MMYPQATQYSRLASSSEHQVKRLPSHPSDLSPPSKRPRLGHTPSSSSSRSPLPSTTSRDQGDVDFFHQRMESAMRLKDAWAQLEQRYVRHLDEDDIIDLREETLLKDRGVVRNITTQINFGDISDETVNGTSSNCGGVHCEHLLPNVGIQLRRVKSSHLDSEDENDLKNFLEDEKRMREDPHWTEELGEEEAEEGATENHSTEETNFIAESDYEDESDDELGRWEHDESTAIYEVRHVATEKTTRYSTPRLPHHR